MQQSHAIYDFDLTSEVFPNRDSRTHVTDYVRQAYEFATTQFGEFTYEYLDPLSELTEFLPPINEEQEVNLLYKLYRSHSSAVQRAYRRMVDIHDPIFSPLKPNTLYEVINARRFQNDRAECMAEDIAQVLSDTIPIALASTQIKHENALNDHIQAILKRDKAEYEREYPTVRFSFSTVVPDHSGGMADLDLFIESKYIRKSTPPSKITDQIAADLMKYPPGTFKLFIIYDPERRIKDDTMFKRDFIKRENCTINIVR